MIIFWVITAIIVSILIFWLIAISVFKYFVKLAVNTVLDEIEKRNNKDEW
jgi:uncharacterized protein YxeA